MIVCLIGYMGSGKTTKGRKLAKLMNFSFFDLDEEIEKHVGKSIKDIFAIHGEVFFREREREILISLLHQDNTVISTGGGTPCYRDNMDMINKKSLSVYIKLSPTSICHRLENAKEERPLLKEKKGVDLLFFIQQHLQEREKFYTQAKLTVEGENLTTAELLELVTYY